MNDRDPQGTHDHDERAVDDFFAAHRRQVVDQAADDQTWQVVRDRAGRSSGRSRGMWFLGGAVAASAVALAVLVGQGLGGPDALAPAGPGPTDPVLATGPQTDAPSVTAEPLEPVEEEDLAAPAATDEPTQEPPSPETFSLPAPDPAAEIDLVREPTGDEGDLRTTTYDVDCPAAYEWHCPALAVSEDGGATWTARVDMFEAGYYAAVSSRERTWMWADGGGVPGTIPEVQRGLVRSDDGGRTWRTVQTRGDGVLWVEAFRSTLVVVTEGCEGGPVADCVEVVLTDVAADDATSGRRVVTIEDLPPMVGAGPQPLPAGSLEATFDAVYLHMPWRDVTYRIADGEEVATPVPQRSCRLSTAPESPDTVLALCPGDTLRRSQDGGGTWQELPGPEGDVQAVASNDGQRLAVATDRALWLGPGEDGTWQRIMDRSSDWSHLAALGGRSMVYGGPYRSYPDGDPTLSQRWTSEDDGQTWAEQPRIDLRSAP